MDSFDYAHLLYLLLLFAVIGGWFAVSNHQSRSKTMQHALVWGLIFMGAIAVAGLWQDIRRAVFPGEVVQANGSVEVPLGRDGHFHLTVRINDVPIDMIVDTGASQMVLSMDDARRVGINMAKLNFIGNANTANGVVSTASVRLGTVSVAGLTDRNFRASVNGGAMETSLLGMSYLRLYSSVELQPDRLILTR